MLRPIQRVYPLEVQSTETPDDPLNDCTFTNPISSISSDMLSDPNDSSSVLPRVSSSPSIERYGYVIILVLFHLSKGGRSLNHRKLTNHSYLNRRDLPPAPLGFPPQATPSTPEKPQGELQCQTRG
ncbi:hypothetical protein TNIN_120261 [Trichonephila inaurata madagascariensis]|uniref:Uncharacterized protein n=1 Tax=Trichonephila inaurata madagascariensis TaxID=2747483 RepID=A0A8X6M5R8_9ARAC|nr:hypothetical protein TNIN_120261 [Trichonephila inaurata madagascariensis]